MKNGGSVRRSVIAGTWYPAAAPALRRVVQGYLSGVETPPVAGRLLGLISPHAGYAYSGQTAAYAYGQLSGRRFDTVVLVAPNHRAWFDEVAFNVEDAYETPLGPVPIDRGFVQDLSSRIRLQPVRADSEHALEIQLPFLQVQLGDFGLVPLLVSAGQPSVAQRLAAALVETIRAAAGRAVLLVASSDMHHIDDHAEVARRDGPVADALAALDLERLTALFQDPRCSVCGWMPILTVLQAALALGADAVQVLHRTNSAEVTGERRPGQYTVGYLAAAVYRTG